MGTLRALADTSVLIGLEQDRIKVAALPALALSTVTIGELKLGLLSARDVASRATRLRTLQNAMRLEAIPIDEQVADAWAEMRLNLRAASKRLDANDSWIAATAIAHGLPLMTQDRDYDDVPGLTVIAL